MASYDQLVKDSKGTVFNVAANVAYSTPDQLAMDLGVKANQIQWGNIKTDANYKLPSITSSQLQSPPQVQVPTAPATTAQANSAVAGSQQATSAAQDMINKAAALQTAEQKQASSYTQDILTLLQQTSGQKQALLEEQNKAGLPQMNQEVAALTADLQRQVAEYNATSSQYDKLITDEEGKVKPMGAIRGEQGRLARARAAELNLKASDAKITEARIAGKLGQIEQAQSAAKQAVELRYAPQMEALEVKTKQLSALQASGILDQQSKIQATALVAQYEADQAALAEKKAKEQNNLQLSLSLGINTELANRNGEFFNVRTGKTYGTPEELFADYGVKSFEELYSRGMVSNIDNATIQEKSQVGQIMAQYWDAGIKITDTYEQALQKAKANSRIYGKETYIAPSSSGLSGLSNTGSPSGSTFIDERVKQIIAENPDNSTTGTGWGTAADQIDAQFGKGTATAYDSWLKAAYQDGKPVNQLGASPVSNDAILKTILASGKLTNQQRADVVSYIQSSGLPGAQQWWVNNKLGAGEREAYNLYASSSQILAGVLPTLEATNQSSVGPYKALFENKKPFLLMQQDPQYSQTYQMIETAQAQIRKGFYGTAVTGSEQGNAKRFLIDPNDSYTTMVAKVKGLMGVLAFVNDANTLRPFGINVNFEDYVPMDIPYNDISNPPKDEQTKGFWSGLGNWLYGD